MTRPRAVRPTDLVALVSFDGRVFPNEAKTRERIGRTNSAPHPLERALEQWFSFATGCHTWISVRGATLRGLVSARRRGTNCAWELDCVINASEDDDSVCLGLLEQSLKEAGRCGVEKVFLRLSVNSYVRPLAHRLGFVEYQREMLFTSSSPTILIANYEGLPPFRKAVRADDFSLFELYLASMPEAARRAEAATFSEWKASQDRSWLVGRVSQQVAHREGQLVAWVRSATEADSVHFDLLVRPSEPRHEALLDVALRQFGGKRVLTLVPKSGSQLSHALLKRGFDAGPEYAALVKRTAVTASAPQLAPAV